MLANDADKLRDNLFTAFKRGAAAVGYPDAITDLTKLPEPSTSWFSYDNSEAAAQKSVRVLGVRIDTWAHVRRAWAERGRNDDGDTYTWTTWADDAAVYGDELRVLTREALNASALYEFRQGLAATTSDVGKLAVKAATVAADIAQPLKWSLKTKVALGAVATVAVLFVLRPYLQPLLNRVS